MRRKLLFYVLTLISIGGYAQPFEGRISYSNKVESKLPGISDPELWKMMGSEKVFYIKGGRYKNVSNGTMLQWEIYDPVHNKLYVKNSNAKAPYWKDAGVNRDAILGIRIARKAAVILGYPCDELILRCKSGTEKYYYSSKFPANAGVFKMHHYAHWSAYLAKAHALPLKVVIDNRQFRSESTAVAIAAMKLEDGIFEIR